MTRASRCGLIAVLLLPVLSALPAKSAETPLEERFAMQCAGEYEVTREGAQDGAQSAFSFKSRLGASSPEGRIFPRFRLRVFGCGQPPDVAKALRALADEARDSMFHKYPILAVVAGDRLYRLDGSCAISEKAWRTIEARLLDLLPTAPGHIPLPQLRIACGGAVLEPLRSLGAGEDSSR